MLKSLIEYKRLVKLVVDKQRKLETMHDQEKLLIENIKIKDELKSYKNFAFKKNMLEVATAFILANSFNNVVKSLVENIIMPWVNFITNSVNKDWQHLSIKICNNLVLDIGKFSAAFVDFIIITAVFYIIYTKLLKIVPNINDGSSGLKPCKFCYNNINDKATKCPFCTSNIEQ